MESKELRVGNLVSYFNNDMVKVDGISKESGQYYINAKKNNTTYNNVIEAFKPTIITKEILFKYGFNENSDGNYLLSLNQFLNLELMKVGDEWLNFSVEKTNDDNCFSFERIRYVHQLQNLYFALTQKELTFK
jgi:hypothetical protein